MGAASFPADPRLEGMQNQMFSQWLKKTPAEKWGRRMLSKFREGEDVSSYGELADIRQRGATAGANLNADYMTGINALLANTGNAEDISQMNRQRDLARERINQETGREEVAALGDLQRTALSASDPTQRWALNSQNQNAAMQNTLGYYQARWHEKQPPFWQKLLLGGLGAAGQVAGAVWGK